MWAASEIVDGVTLIIRDVANAPLRQNAVDDGGGVVAVQCIIGAAVVMLLQPLMPAGGH